MGFGWSAHTLSPQGDGIQEIHEASNFATYSIDNLAKFLASSTAYSPRCAQMALDPEMGFREPLDNAIAFLYNDFYTMCTEGTVRMTQCQCEGKLSTVDTHV